MRRPILGIILVLVVIGIVVLATQLAKPDADKPVVAATIYPAYDLARSIGEGVVEPVMLLPKGASPHTFEPTPETLGSTQSAAVIYRIGYGIDDWVTQLGADSAPLVTLDTNIALLRTDDIVDPHYWLSAPNLKIMAQNIATDLSARFPNSSTTIQTNLDATLAEIDAADRQIRALIEARSNRFIATMHPAWAYFAKEYGLTIVGTYENNVGVEPGPQDIVMLAKEIRAHDITTFFGDASESEAAVETFAKDNDLRFILLDPEGVGGEYTSVSDLLVQNARIIAENE